MHPSALKLSEARSRLRSGVRVSWRPDRWTYLAAAIYLVCAVLLTWPMPEHIGSLLYGQGGDAFGAVGDMQQLLNSHLIPFLPGTLHGIGAPAGRPWNYPLSIATIAVFLPRWILSLAFGAVPAWNLYVLTGYLLTGSAMFLFVRRLTRSVAAGLVAGWAYAFFPFADQNGQAHVDYIHNWVLVLLLWRGLELLGSPTRRNAWLVGAATALALLWQPYFWLYAFAILVTLFVVDMVLSRRERTSVLHLSRWALAMVAPGVILIGLALIEHTYHVGAGAVPNEGLSDFYTYSARPLDYLIPIPGSGLVPSSDFTSAYAQGYAGAERGIYVGWSVLALAITGLLVAFRARWVDRRMRMVVISIALIGVVAFVLSGIPTWRPFGLFTIYMPTWFIAHITGAWRDFARYVEVVELALCVLLGFAVAAIAKLERRWLGAILLVAVSVVLVRDLWWKADPNTIALPTNPIYQALGRQHDTKVAAQYPIMFDIYPDYDYTLASDVDHHRILNGAYGGTPDESRDLWLGVLNNHATGGLLARLNVGWVMINELDPAVSSGQAPPPGKPGRGYQLVTSQDNWQLWRVTAKPAFGQLYSFTGFQRPAEQGTAGFVAAWMNEPTGTIVADASHCTGGCNAIMRFGVSSYSQPRRLTLRYHGRVLDRVDSPVGSVKTVSIRIHLDGPRETISLDQTPNPQIGYANGKPIGGPFGIEISDPLLLPARGA